MTNSIALKIYTYIFLISSESFLFFHSIKNIKWKKNRQCITSISKVEMNFMIKTPLLPFNQQTGRKIFGFFSLFFSDFMTSPHLKSVTHGPPYCNHPP